jgi:MYXO-CTERM domain-containing protein
VHAVAALLLLAITAVTDTWAAGGIVLGLVALSLAVTLALLRSVERRR